jgi:hypothetical protein
MRKGTKLVVASLNLSSNEAVTFNVSRCCAGAHNGSGEIVRDRNQRDQNRSGHHAGRLPMLTLVKDVSLQQTPAPPPQHKSKPPLSPLPRMAARGGEGAARARIGSRWIAAQVDFTHAGDLLVFVDEDQISALERDMKQSGVLEGSKMAMAFNMLRPNDLIWSYVVGNYLKGRTPPAFDLLHCNSDATRMPAANHFVMAGLARLAARNRRRGRPCPRGRQRRAPADRERAGQLRAGAGVSSEGTS